MTSRRRAVPLPPMWARWALAITVAVAVIVGVVIATNRVGPEGGTSEAEIEAEDNRLADIAITEDEAPHFAGLPAGANLAAALERAIGRDVRQRIAAGHLTGPVQDIACSAAGTSRAGRVPYRCTVRSAGITYEFLAVVNQRRQRLTWCKVDQSSVADTDPEIPISASCRV